MCNAGLERQKSHASLEQGSMPGSHDVSTLCRLPICRAGQAALLFTSNKIHWYQLIQPSFPMGTLNGLSVPLLHAPIKHLVPIAGLHSFCQSAQPGKQVARSGWGRNGDERVISSP
jgi:hypothetical protein